MSHFRLWLCSSAMIASLLAPASLAGFQLTGTPPTSTAGMGSRSSRSAQSPQRPVYISGKVIMEDGSPLPPRVAIRRTCQGNSSRRETYVDPHGSFSFQIGGIQTSESVHDVADNTAGWNTPNDLTSDPLTQSPAAYGGGPVPSLSFEQLLWGCEVAADFPGYRSDSISLAGRNFMDNSDIGTLVLHRIGTIAGSMISITSMKAPKDARKQLTKARESYQKGKLADAQSQAEKAVTQYPQFAEAWYLLGELQEKQKRIDEARTNYQRSIRADDKFMAPYLALARLAGVTGNWPEADRMSAKVMELDGVDFPLAFLINAVANYNLANFEVAEKSARRAEQLDSQHHMPRIQLLLGTLLERKGDYPGAAGELREYLKLAPQAADARDVEKHLAGLEKVKAAAAKPEQGSPQP